jgi:hypothetical protein
MDLGLPAFKRSVGADHTCRFSIVPVVTKAMNVATKSTSYTSALGATPHP